jgi:type IV secretion system protein VirD4
MQLPPSDELVLVSGLPPIRAKKARYYEDIRLTERVLPPPQAISHRASLAPSDDWSRLPAPSVLDPSGKSNVSRKAQIADIANSGIRREPELPQHEEVVREPAKATPEFAFGEEESVVRAQSLPQQARSFARQAAMDPGDGLKLSE